MADKNVNNKDSPSLDLYFDEAAECLIELEDALLELEERPGDSEQIGRAFRAVHTVKGSGSMYGLKDIAGFSHEMETVFDLVREKTLPLDKRIMDLVFQAKDLLCDMLDAARTDRQWNHKALEELSGKLNALIPKKENTQPDDAVSGRSSAHQKQGSEITYRVRFVPSHDVFLKGVNPVMLIDDLRQMGPCHILAQTRAVPDIEQYDPEQCYVTWDILVTTRQGINAIRDVFIFVEDDSELIIEPIGEGGALSENECCRRLGEILADRGDISCTELEQALQDTKRIGELLVEAGLIDAHQVEAALAEQDHLKKLISQRKEQRTLASIHVSSDKLDSLVNLVGELVTVQARLSQTTAGWDDFDLVSDSSELVERIMANNCKLLSDMASVSAEVERLTTEIRDTAMSIRMVPIGTVFTKLRRHVRDLGEELDRDVRLVTAGGETELDKTVIEKLDAPLVHIIRNCVDHGIEHSDEREKAGKPQQGTISLSAEHADNFVLIRIEDDGRGLDPEYIRLKAIERGVIHPDASLSREELFKVIFAPGFSTADRVTDVSGRGVGMDVVKKGVESLKGNVDVQSVPGQSTVITMKIPLTLAIIDGLLVRVGEDRFVVPLTNVEECVELTTADLEEAHGKHIVNVRKQAVPYIRLRDRFGINGETPGIEQVVVTDVHSSRVGIVVDEVIGEHQTVIKSLGGFYQNVRSISGATILGDGGVALILDMAKLYRDAVLDESFLNSTDILFNGAGEISRDNTSSTSF